MIARASLDVTAAACLAAALLGCLAALVAGCSAGTKRPEPADRDAASTPRVLIIGDSISIGYTKPLKEILAGRAVVEHNPGNAAHSANGLARLDEWLGDERWDVIHFNHGLHDLKWVDDNGKNVRTREGGHIQIPLAEYEKNLGAIVVCLKKTGAALIFATTTPYPGTLNNPLREEGMAEAYNAAALKVMERHGVAVNDLYAFALPRLAELQRPKNVHFTPAGSRALAEEVARHVLTAAGLPADATESR